MRIVIGSDHAGVLLKNELGAHLTESGHEVADVGTHTSDRVDYPDFGAAAARVVAAGDAELAVLVCGSGNGIAMAANRIPGVRAAVVHDVTSARLARAHNDANAMALGERFIGTQVALDAVDAFVSTSFDGGRHAGRVAKLDALSTPNTNE